MKRLQLVCLAVLLSFLTSCGLLMQQPPTQAVRLAVTQQLTHAQQTIAQELGVRYQPTLKPNFKIDQLNIQSRAKVSEPRFQQPGYPSDIYKVKGSFNTTLKASDGKIQQSSPFEIYLGTNPKPKKNNPKTSANSEANDSTWQNNPVETWFLINPNEVKPIP